MHAEYRWRGKAIGSALRRASRVIAVSERLREFSIGMGVPPDRAVTIPNGIDTTLCYPRGTAPRSAGGSA